MAPSRRAQPEDPPRTAPPGPDPEGDPAGLGPDRVAERLTAELATVDRRIATVADELLSANTELSTLDQHPADNGTNMAERETQVSLLESLRGRRDEITAAIDRLHAGTYGIDEETGAPIDPQRLEAVPWARTNVRTRRTMHPIREAP